MFLCRRPSCYLNDTTVRRVAFVEHSPADHIVLLHHHAPVLERLLIFENQIFDFGDVVVRVLEGKTLKFRLVFRGAYRNVIA